MAGTYTITVLPAHSWGVFVLGFEPRISRVLGERHNQARPQEHAVASNEDRTRDLALTKRMLCQLSYRGGAPARRDLGVLGGFFRIPRRAGPRGMCTSGLAWL